MGIWKYCTYFNTNIEQKYRLSLQEGDTPIENYPKLDVQCHTHIYFKREDKNPNGSHKDRSIAFQVSKYYQDGIPHVTISSSGNSAISAAAYCSLAGIHLTLFLSPSISEEKKKRLESIVKKNKDITVIYSPQAKTACFRFALEQHIPNMTPSKDSHLAMEGMQTLGIELAQETEHIDAIFMPASSALGFVSMVKGYTTLKPLIPMHIVQTSKIHPIAQYYDTDFTPESNSFAKAIVARAVPLINDARNIINTSHGAGWVIENAQLEEAYQILQKQGIHTSYDAALSLAGLLKAQRKGIHFTNAICILTGK